MSKNFETIILATDEGVSTITLNRPEVLNAMSPRLLQELEEAVDQVSRDASARAVIITGAGRGFCSGGDVKLDVSTISAMDPFEFRDYIHIRLITKLAELEKPVVAAINGVAAGGGLDLALACDIRFAAENARFGQLYIRRGIIPDLGGAYFLPRLVGPSKAKLMIFTGDLIDAAEAERIGLVDKVLPPDRLMSATRELAGRLAKGPSKAIGMAKVAINKSLTMDLASSLDYTRNLQYFLAHTEDHREGFQAFLEKRQPVYRGK